MITKLGAASAAIGAILALGLGGLAHAGPHAAPGHNIFHPKGIAPGQGGAGGGGHNGGHHKHNGDQQATNCNAGASGATDQEGTDTTKKTKKGKKKKDVDTACLPVK